MAKKAKNIVKKVSSFVLPQLGVVGGAANGLIQGQGLKGALQGGLQGGANAIASIGGQMLGSQLLGGGNILGSVGGKLGAGGMGPPTPASGIAGVVGKITGAGTGGGSSLFSGNSLSNVLSGAMSYNTQDDLEEQLLKAQGRAADQLLPYQSAGLTANNQLSQNLQNGFNPADLENDPGYQFNLKQGLGALDKASAARGSYYSGAALKEAQDYGQGLADNTYNAAFNRNAVTNNQLAGVAGRGQQAAGSLAGIYDTEGDIRGNATVGKSNILTGTLSNLLSGNGARRVMGYDAQGNPIYEPSMEGMY